MDKIEDTDGDACDGIMCQRHAGLIVPVSAALESSEIEVSVRKRSKIPNSACPLLEFLNSSGNYFSALPALVWSGRRHQPFDYSGRHCCYSTAVPISSYGNPPITAENTNFRNNIC
jgi:hypothetical protein